MRPLTTLSAVLLTAVSPALAQVTVDLHALQALPEHRTGAPEQRTATRAQRGAPYAPPPALATRTQPSREAPQASQETPQASQEAPGGSRPTPPASREVPMATRESPSSAPTTSRGAPLPAPPAPQPNIPESVPETATINPIAPPQPPAGAPPPAPPPVSDKAATTAAATPAGLRLTFAPGQSDLSPDSTASIKQLTTAAPAGDATTFNVLAFAPGKPDDPSTARRVSLSRAMAVRSALVADGVPSARIFVRALGEQYGDGPADRVDIGVTGVTSDTATTR